MYKDIAQYVKDCPHCQVAKGPYVGPRSLNGHLLCVDFNLVPCLGPDC